MSPLASLAISAVVVIVAVAPMAINAWLSGRETAEASLLESKLDRSAGGAE